MLTIWLTSTPHFFKERESVQFRQMNIQENKIRLARRGQFQAAQSRAGSQFFYHGCPEFGVIIYD